jgi:hypothetical protein
MPGASGLAAFGIGVRRYGIVQVRELIWLLRYKSSATLVYVIASVPFLLVNRTNVTIMTISVGASKCLLISPLIIE